MIGEILDTRKLRRTPLPDIDSLLSPTGSSSLNTSTKRSSLRNSKKQSSSLNASTKRTSLRNSKRRSSSLSTKSSTGFKETPRNSVPNDLSLKDKSIPPERRFSVPIMDDEKTLKESDDKKQQSTRSSVKNDDLDDGDDDLGDEDDEDLDDKEEEDPEDEEPDETDSSPRNEKKRTRSDELRNKIVKRTRADELRERIAEEELKEKRELIYEFWLMEKNGIPVSKKYEITDDIDEMRFEYHRLKSEGDIRDKIKLGWSVFSSINSVGEMINQKFKPLGISIDGWSDELDSHKEEYEKIFRKIYKNMAGRFYVKPGLQLMMVFGSQLIIFLAPRLLKKFQKKEDDDGPRIHELDEKGNVIPSETVKKIADLQSSISDIRTQFVDQFTKMQQQQLLLIQSQQKFFEQITRMMRTSTESSLNEKKKIEPIRDFTESHHDSTSSESHHDSTSSEPRSSMAKLTDQKPRWRDTIPVEEIKKTNPEDESEYEEVEVEVTDDESDAQSPPIVNLSQTISKADEEAANSLGQVITQMQPLVNVFRRIRNKDDEKPLNTYMYDKPPEIPESMKEQHESMVKRGILPKETQSLSTTIPQDETKEETPKTTPKSSKKLETWNL